MHIPDGFIDAGTSAGAGVVAAAGVAVCLKKAADTMQEKQVAMAGLVSAFIFAVQMLNFPVASGTSGHLLGGLLAAVLVGPWVGALCVSVVLFVQALVFADGGLERARSQRHQHGARHRARRICRLPRAALAAAAHQEAVSSSRPGSPGFLSVVMASLAFTLEYAAGGAGGVSVSTVFGAMVGVHVLIGIGEGIITAATVAVVLAVRPDVVYGASDLEPELELRAGLVTTSGDELGRRTMTVKRRTGMALFAVGAVVVALLLAAFASPFASTAPDGLNKVAIDKGFDRHAKESAVADSPLAGYAVKDVQNEKVSKGLSGIAGVAITLLIAGALFGGLWFVARRRSAGSRARRRPRPRSTASG